MDLNHIIAAGVVAQLVLSAARHFANKKQQARLDAIQAQLSSLLSNVTGSAGLSSGSASTTAGKDGG